MRTKFFLPMVVVCLTLSPFQNVLAQGGQGVPEWDLKSAESRAAVVEQLRSEGETAHNAAWRGAVAEGWSPKGSGDGFKYELQAIRDERLYIYRTMNVNAAISSASNQIRNTVPYSVNGSGETVGIWDGGAVRSTHQELTGRVTVMDGAAIIDHATHVGGTIGAAGVVSSALGMAPSVQIASYDWNNDLSEMTSLAMATSGASGMIQLSNHSYGTISGWDTSDGTYKWYGAVLADHEDANFGQYYSTARDWDTLCYSAPYYLPCKAVGNDRSDLAPPAGTTFSYYSRRKWVAKIYDPATDPYNDGYNNGGFDTLEPTSTAKNILSVGAVNDAVSGGSRSLSAAGMTTFSGWGPTDDGRIKPDVVGNGYSLYSSLGSGDASYAYYSGTSMATPNVCGSLVLLTDYYGQLFPGQCMRASTLKGLVIHTADDLGAAGPDYKSGWGLVNVKAAADLIKLHYDEPTLQHLVEQSLTTATTSRTNSFTWSGTNAIRVTLCWTDPAGTAQTGLDVTTKNLVNDLDLRVIGPTGQVYLPYVLVPSTPDVAATAGDNSIDNVEQVYISVPGTSGVCRITVSLHGALSGTSQPYSIIFSVLGASSSTYTVTFDAQGGSTPVPTSTSVTYGSTYGTLATTTRTGYTFGGWWTGTGGTGTQVLSATPVTITSAQTLYAKWTANTYTVTFDAQGGTTPVPASTSVTYGSTYGTLATTTRTGYTFGGWWTGTGGTGTQVLSATPVTITSAQTLFAKWTANTYTVTFDAQVGTTPVPASTSVTYGSTYGTLATTTRTGYTFGGWWTGTGGTGTQVLSTTTVTITAPQTLYAKWTAGTYTVTFDAQGGITPVPTSTNVTYGSTYGTLATTTRAGYTFGGWWTGTGGTGTQVLSATPVSITSAQTLYAKWTANTYTVTFDAQGGSTPVPTSTSVTYGSTYGTLATTTRAGYTFGGWRTGTGGAGTQVLSTTPVTITSAQTLYALWIATVTTTTLIPVPYTWLDQYPLLLSLASGDYEAMALADADGDGQMAWQEYVAGTVPTNRESFFMSLISFSNGVPWVTWTPDLSTARVYNVEGRTNLTEGAWGPTNAGSRFFRVNVWLP